MRNENDRAFNRICLHRLDAASQYLHDKRLTKKFTDSIQGVPLIPGEMQALGRRKLSYMFDK